MHTTQLLGSLVIGALVLAGCNKDGEDTGTATKPDETSAGESTAGVGTTTGASATSTDPTTSGGPGGTGGTGGGTGETGVEPTGGEEESGCGFVCTTGGGGGGECDVWAQDCPEGEKCMPWDNMGGNSWNATKCSPVAPDPKQSGDSCNVEGSAVSGIDDCDKGLICWDVNDENVGTCADMCTGSMAAPMCPGDKVCSQSNEGVVIVCLDSCDPLVQSCPEGQICFSDGGHFICDFDASGMEGQYGDPCVYINECDYGLFCALQANVPGCANADGCCSAFCDISEPNTCPGADMGQECLPWYVEGESPEPGLENLGFCGVQM